MDNPALYFVGIVCAGIFGILIGNYTNECPSCNCICPDYNCPVCKDVTATDQITKFEYDSNIITLYNDRAMVTTEEVIHDYETKEFHIMITNRNHENKSDINGKLCIEQKFYELDIDELTQVEIPDSYYTNGPEYHTDCWQLPIIKHLELAQYNILFRNTINQNQTVKISVIPNQNE